MKSASPRVEGTHWCFGFLVSPGDSNRHVWTCAHTHTHAHANHCISFEPPVDFVKGALRGQATYSRPHRRLILSLDQNSESLTPFQNSRAHLSGLQETVKWVL